MKFILTLALKNLSRYKRRTSITAVAIAVGLMMFLLVDSILIGSENESMRNLRWYETASARIHTVSYWDDRLLFPMESSIEDPEAVLDLLNQNGWKATARTVFTADMMLYSEDFGEDGNMNVLVTAIDPEKDNDVFHFSDTLIEGRFLEKGDENGILIGSWFAEDINAKVGHWITLVARGNGGFYEAMDMQIVGILNCPNPNVNRTLLMMDKDTAGYYLGMDGAVTEIDVLLSEHDDIDAEVAKIQTKIEGAQLDLEVRGWEELAKDYLAIAEAKRGGTAMILFLVFIIAAVGISNTMLMAMYERTRELGMMRSMGMSDNHIRLAFLFEAGGIGFIGAFFGIILGLLVNIYMVNVGIDFGWMMRDMDMGYRIQSIIRGAWSITSFIEAFFAGIGLSMIVAWVPINRALKMDIPACLRHQ